MGPRTNGYPCEKNKIKLDPTSLHKQESIPEG